MPTFSVDPHRLEELLNYCVDFAKQMLEGHGEFHPFGAVIGPDGKLTAVGGHVGDEHPKGADVYLLLQSAFKSKFEKGEIVAAAIAANVNTPVQFESPSADGIRVLLECPGYGRFIYMPYRVEKVGFVGRLFRKHLRCEYYEHFAVETPPTLWGKSNE